MVIDTLREAVALVNVRITGADIEIDPTYRLQQFLKKIDFVQKQIRLRLV